MKRSKIQNFCRPIIGTVVGAILFVLLSGTLGILALLGRRKKAPQRNPNGPYRVLITGRVDSKNWCMSHLKPLVNTTNISELLLVVDGRLQTGLKTRQFMVPGWIGWFKPRAIVRSLWAVRIALQEKPDIVMAYSLFPPGVFGLLAARLTGAAAIVQLAGGLLEIESGGYATDEPLIPGFLTKHLVPMCQTLCSHFDGVIVRGRKAETYVQKHSKPGRIEIIPGSVDSGRFHLNGQLRTVDIVFVGRIVGIKQPDHVCQVVHRVAQRRPSLRVVIAGQGPLLNDMRRQANELGLQKVIRFVGHVEKVEGLLTRSRVFLLTSRSEGLSIAMAEAMIAGAVPVVPDVGDLSELVVNGQTGWLIEPGNFDAYADKICDLLDDQKSWAVFSDKARQFALNNNALDSVSRRWQSCLSDVVEHHSQSSTLLN